MSACIGPKRSPPLDLPHASPAAQGGEALLEAAANFHTETVEEILTIDGVDANGRNSGGMTPLMLAAECGHTETVRVLLTANAIDVNALDSDGFGSALTLAARCGYAATVDALLSADGIDVNLANEGRDTALTAAVEGGIFWHVGFGFTAIVTSLLCAKGIDLTAHDQGSRALSLCRKKEGFRVYDDGAIVAALEAACHWAAV